MHVTDASQANFHPFTSMSDQDKDPIKYLIQAPPPSRTKIPNLLDGDKN